MRRLLTTQQVANALAVSDDWVREHAAELGGIRLSDGPRSPLRFEPGAIEDWKSRRRVAPPPTARPRHKPGARRRPPADVELLPLPD